MCVTRYRAWRLTDEQTPVSLKCGRPLSSHAPRSASAARWRHDNDVYMRARALGLLMVAIGMVCMTVPAQAASDLQLGLATPSIDSLRQAEARLGFPVSIVSLYADFVQPFPHASVDAVHGGGAAALIS